MKKFLTILLILFLCVPIFGCKKKENINKLSESLSTYEIDLKLDVKTNSATATQTIYYINNTNSILKTIKLHLYPKFFEEGATEKIVPSTKMNNTYPNGMSYAKFNIDRVVVDEIDKPIIYENEFDSILSVELNSSLLPDEKVKLYFEYSLIMPNCNHRFGYGNNTINLANFYPIICVYEDGSFNTNGYNSNGDPFYSEMANYCVNISIDKQYILASTGKKISETTENETKHISLNARLVRDFAIVASPNFQVVNQQHNNTNVEYYYFNDPHPSSSLQAGVDAIKTFTKLFGDYPYETFSIVECDFIYGGMEYPNLIMISTDISNEDDYLNVIIHETAHQWWYGMVGNDEFTYPWLDEALTEYSTILFYDYNKNYNLNHTNMVNISKENYTLFISVYEDVLGPIDTSMRAIDQYSTEPEYTYCTYVKGVLMFESLYQLIGKNDFCKSLKYYFENYKYTNVTPQDLIISFEKTTNQNLSNFFESWTKGKVIIR